MIKNGSFCIKCKKPLESDAIPIYRKLVNRGAEEFLCIGCLADSLGVSRKEIENLIDFYTESGTCALF